MTKSASHAISLMRVSTVTTANIRFEHGSLLLGKREKRGTMIHVLTTQWNLELEGVSHKYGKWYTD